MNILNVIKLAKSASHGVRHFGSRIRMAYRASHLKRPYLNDIVNMLSYDLRSAGGWPGVSQLESSTVFRQGVRKSYIFMNLQAQATLSVDF